MKSFLLFLSCLSTLLAARGQVVYKPDPGHVLYVNAMANENPADYNWMGDSWQKAIPSLSMALRAADSLNHIVPGVVKQIWVAKGIYTPLYSAEDGHHQEDGGRNNAFLLLKDVKIYGGFSGMETTLGQRDTAKLFSANITTLSGDLGVAGNAGDNAFHVIVAAGQTGRAELNGFVIAGGNANESGVQVKISNHLIDNNRGGGFCGLDAEAIIANCLFKQNTSTFLGGGIFVLQGKLDVSNCRFIQNRSENGGALYNSGARLAMQRCLFSDNAATNGGGAFMEESFDLNIEKCTFSGNEALYGGGGIYDSSAGPAITSCVFTGNHAAKGGAMYNVESSEPVVTNAVFSSNVAEDWGGGAYDNYSFPNYIGCLFAGNKATYGGAVCSDNNSVENMLNCTIAGNLATAADGGGAIRIYNASPTIVNTIIWGNNTGISAGMNAAPNISYTIVQSEHYAGSNHNLVEDPMFVNPVPFSEAPDTGGDYRLKTASPALDYGTGQFPDYIRLPNADLAGDARLIGVHLDLGAYEIQGYAPDKNGILYVNRNVSGGDGTGNSWSNAFPNLSEALLVAGQLNNAHPGTVKEIWVAKGTYHPLYSAKDGHPAEDGGRYNAFVLLSNVKLYGGFAGTETSLDQRAADSLSLFSHNPTILDGENKRYHVLVAAAVDAAAIDGFIIKNGASAEGQTFKVHGLDIPLNDGGGMDIENSTVAITRCRFENNNASSLGGALNSYNSDVAISFCWFEGNGSSRSGGAVAVNNEDSHTVTIRNTGFRENHSAAVVAGENIGGGALFLNGSSTYSIADCDFNGNYTSGSSHEFDGGAIFNYACSPEITRCSFTGNRAGFAGAIYNRQASPTIANCEFTQNVAEYTGSDFVHGSGGAIYNSTSSANVVNCLFTGNTAVFHGGAISNNYQSAVTISGSLFSGNYINFYTINHGYIYEGNAIYSDIDAKVSIINCTVILRKWHSMGIDEGVVSHNADSKIINSIIWGPADVAAVSGNISYSIVQTTSGSVIDGDGNMNKDPKFLDPANGNYRLKTSSPAIAAGTSSIAQYHLPDADLDNNPRVVDGKINMGAYASTFVHPTKLTATYDGRDTINISWEAPLQGDESYVSGDNFKLERSADSTFEGSIKTVTSNVKYEPDKKVYKIQDDITDVSGGLVLYYRLTRTMAQNQDWQQAAYDTAAITVLTHLEGIGTDTLVADDGAVHGDIQWQPFTGVWPQGTVFNLIKKNMTDGTQQSISIDEDIARTGHYEDANIPTCKEIRYTLSVKLGNHYASPPDADIPDSILTEKLAPISDITASKGYYPDRTSLRWSTTGSYDRYVIKRRVYGSPDAYEQIAAVDGKGLLELNADDDKGTPGVYYQYLVTGLAQCSDVILYSDTLHAIGFRSPTGTVYGRVTYDNGGGAVQGATVRMESADNTKLGKSVYLDGQRGSNLRLDSLSGPLGDSSFTLGVWIKPADNQPKGQIIFTREGQYTLGFDEKGQLYFACNGSTVTAPYTRDTINGWAHVSAVHKADSLLLMLHANDTVITSQKRIVFQPADDVSDRIFIGSNSDGANFKGNIDELRLWNIARDSAAIAKDYSRLLTGGEEGLAAYWRFDATIRDQFYDISHDGENYNRNDGTMDPLHVKRSDVIPAPEQLSLKAYTDSTGNYTITGIPYTGVNGTTYAVAPMLGSHHFDPVNVTRIFSAASSSFTLDFKDKSSYTVSGTVYYAHTNVPVQGVQFKIDGTYAYNGNGGIAQTNGKGEFRISVPVGVHRVSAEKANHVFKQGGRILDVSGQDVNYQQDLAGITIQDSTTVRFIGRVAGGTVQSNYPLGFSLSSNILGAAMKITLKAKGDYFLNYDVQNPGADPAPVTRYYRHVLYSNSQQEPLLLPDSTKVVYSKTAIVIYPDTTTGEFEADLIPAAFILDQDNGVAVTGYPSPLSSAMELNLTDSLLQKTITDTLNRDSVYDVRSGNWTYTTHYDTVKYNAASVFTYNVDPVVTVEQAMGPGNPNTFDYFGNASYSFTDATGGKTDIPVYDEKTKTYTFGHPVFVQGNSYVFKVRSFQRFPYYDAGGNPVAYTDVPSRGGKVIVHNEMKAGTGASDVVDLDSSGTAFYSFQAGGPELTGSRLKGYTIAVQLGNEIYQWKKGLKQEGYVFGGQQDGSNFVTAGPNMRIGVLRDPPGSGSYAFLEQGFTASHSIAFTTNTDFTNAVGGEISIMPEFESTAGTPVFKVGTTIEPIVEASASFVLEEHQSTTSTTTTSLTLTSNVQTSGDPSFDGAPNDIFIGYSTNITYGQSRMLKAVPSDAIQATDSVIYGGKGKTAFSIVEREGIHSGQQFETMYLFSQLFIEQYLIPNLTSIRNKILAEGGSYSDPQAAANILGEAVYVSRLDTSDEKYGSYNTDKKVWDNPATSENFTEGPSYQIFYPRNAKGELTTVRSDTIMILDQHIEGWLDWLKENEKDKVTADYKDNYSFGAGSSIDITRQASTEKAQEIHYQYIMGAKWSGSLGLLINKAGIIATEEGERTSSKTDTTGTTYTDTTTTIGFHLEEGGSNYMSISVGDDPNGFPVYQTKGGVTACPYEDSSYTRYYEPGTLLNQPTIKREVPELKVNSKAIVTGIAANRPASYTLLLSNASSIKEDIQFGLKVIDKSNPYGAKIYLDGTPLGNGRTLLIPAGETLTKTLTVEKGPDSMNYDNIQLSLHSLCQEDINSVTTISAHFLPACSDIHLSSPSDQWLINTLSPEIVKGTDTVPYLPVVLDRYDLNRNLFDHIELQYKAATSPDWITVTRFFTDSARYKDDHQGGSKEVIPSPDKTSYNFLMNSTFADGLYDIRAMSVCMDNGRVVAQTPSNTVSGIKDTYKPRPFGNPQPANGILGIGQNASIKFNEPIDIGYLNQQSPFTFFTVKGIKNGSAIDSTVAIQFDGQKDYAATEFDKNMTEKDFTIACWIMADKAGGTLFSQGNRNNSVELALAEDNHLKVIIGDKTFTNSRSIDAQSGQWAHIALVYHRNDSTVHVFYNYKEMLTGTKAPAYTGIGPFVFGKSLKHDGDFFAGKMRGLRVWTMPLTAISLQENSTKTLSGGESHLLACYPMDEGKGNVLYDKAHGNNAAFTGSWKMPDGRSVALNGDGYVRLNTSQAVITPDMDFTISLWFKAMPGQTEGTLISSGKGDGTDLSGSRNLYALGFDNGSLTFANNNDKIVIDGNYLDNQWHQVVIAANRNTGNAQFYVDGQLKKFFDAGNLGGLASTFTYLGARAYRQAPDSMVVHFDRYFKGDIDEVRIWNTYLNSTLISAGGNTRLTGKEVGLLAYYPFEQHVKSSSGIWSTNFTVADQKIQQDPNNHVADAVLSRAEQTNEKAPIKDPGPRQDLSYDFVANNDAIVFNFNGGQPEMKAIDKTIVTFTATNIRDMHGNYIASPVTWTAYIDQNPLSWSDETLSLSKDLNDPMQFESYIVNSGGSEENFNLGNLPPWLTADITAGTVPPEGKQKITFTINRGLNVGAYDAIVEMTNDLQETQGLALNLKVKGQAPDWKVNPADFKYNMSVYGKLRIDQIFSDDSEDMLAVFVNGKCVGLTHNTYFSGQDLWYAFLTVYSDSLQADELEFRIWDASTGKIYAGIPSEPVTFASDGVAGTPDDPVIFDGKEMLFRNIHLNKGWNWISFNLVNDQLKNIQAALSNGSWTPGDEVKHDLIGFDQYSYTAGWIGTLPAFDNVSLFKLKSGIDQILSISGTLPDLKKTPIRVNGGQWNYIGYLPQVNMTLKEALADYEASSGDQIKSQTGFSMYSATKGWVGNLEYLEPGKGYMLFRKGADNTQFNYPVISGSLSIHRQAGNTALHARLNPLQRPVESNYRYANNMTVIAETDNAFTLMPRDKIMAYSGADLRGQAVMINNPVTGRPSFFFNISGENALLVHFAIERNGKVVAQTGPVMSYRPNSMIGDLKEPFMLHFGKPEIVTGIFPNPFRESVTFQATLSPGNHQLQLAVYDVNGKEIRIYPSQTINAKYYRVTWDGRDGGGNRCSAGIYFIHLLVDGKSHVYKVVKQ